METIRGKLVRFHPVLTCYEASLGVFIPKTCQGKKATIILDQGHQINAVSTDALLLIQHEQEYSLCTLPFQRNDNGYACNLASLLDELRISYLHGNGIGCDGLPWDQNGYTEDVILSENWMIAYDLYTQSCILTFIISEARPLYREQNARVRFIYLEKCADERLEELELEMLKVEQSRTIEYADFLKIAQICKTGSSIEVRAANEENKCKDFRIELDLEAKD